MGKMDEKTQRALNAAIKCAEVILESLDLSDAEREIARTLGEQLVARVIKSIQSTLANSTETHPLQSSDCIEQLRRSLCFPAGAAFALAAISEFSKSIDYKFQISDGGISN
jgi:hypothetical protein